MADVSGRYERYKRATRAFSGWLAHVQPPAAACVTDILSAAKAVAARAIRVPAHVLHDLGTSINLREEVHQLYLRSSAAVRESDTKHAHFISTLREVQRVLQPLREAGAQVVESAIKQDALLHSFAVLELEEPSTGPAEDDTVAAESSTVAIGSLHDNDLDFAAASALPQLHAAMFLLDLDELQAKVSTAWVEHVSGRHSLLTATAITNLCIRHIERLAASLAIECPELAGDRSIERCVAAVGLERAVSWCTSSLGVSYALALELVTAVAFGEDDSAPSRSQTPTFHLMAIVGESHPHIRARTAAQVGRLLPALRTQERFGELVEVVWLAFYDVFFQVGEDGSFLGAVDPADRFVGVNAVFHTSELLRKLVRTQRLLDGNSWFAPPAGYYGWVQWNERTRLASSVYELRDHAVSILPALLYFSGNDFLEKFDDLLKEGTLMPLWRLLRSARKHGRLDTATLFAMHASLVSVLHVQGERRCARVAVTTRLEMTQLHEQLLAVLPLWGQAPTFEHPHSSSACGERAAGGALLVAEEWARASSVRLRLDPVSDEQLRARAKEQRDAALLWTPWVAGQQLLFAQLSCRLSCGLDAADSRWQLRLHLHLYNALLQVGALAQPIPLMEHLLRCLADSSLLWYSTGGQRPMANGRATLGIFSRAWMLLSSGATAVSVERAMVRAIQTAGVNRDPLVCALAFDTRSLSARQAGSSSRRDAHRLEARDVSGTWRSVAIGELDASEVDPLSSATSHLALTDGSSTPARPPAAPLPSDQHADYLSSSVRAIQSSFAADDSIDMVAVGAQCIKLLDDLVDIADAHEAVGPRRGSVPAEPTARARKGKRGGARPLGNQHAGAKFIGDAVSAAERLLQLCDECSAQGGEPPDEIKRAATAMVSRLSGLKLPPGAAASSPSPQQPLAIV